MKICEKHKRLKIQGNTRQNLPSTMISSPANADELIMVLLSKLEHPDRFRLKATPIKAFEPLRFSAFM